MASCYLNVLTLHGSGDDVDGFLAKARDGGGPLRFGALVPVPECANPSRWMERQWGSGEPESGMEPPVVFDENGMRVASFTFSTLGGMPGKFAGLLASAMPGTIVTLMSVEPNLREALAGAWDGVSRWEGRLLGDALEAVAEAEGEALDPEAALDALGVLLDAEVGSLLPGNASPASARGGP